MGGPTYDATTRQAHLSQTLKALRRRRGLGVADMANALGMAKRSYQHFESGRSRINLERVHEIARVLNADPYAILAAVDLGSPAFAVRAADNKLITILILALREFDRAAGDQIAQLDPGLLMATFEHAFRELAAQAAERSAVANRWRDPAAPTEAGGGAS
jgi:transcriptional regulator with XRE-family HTH domain